jgi:hypothetical protein
VGQRVHHVGGRRVKRLCFVVPVHQRLKLASICLRQLQRTCDALREDGVEANAVVVSDSISLMELDVLSLGFGWVIRENDYTSAKFNDGIQLATDPRYNPMPADYVVPCGSDDWLDHRLFTEPLPGPNQIFGFQHVSFVREDGREICSPRIGYAGGAGIRIIPRALLEPVGYRPADEDRMRGVDTSILANIRNANPTLEVRHWHLHTRQIVDWKTPNVQLNSYSEVTAIHGAGSPADPFVELADFYPAEALDEMRSYYEELAMVTAA